MLHKCLYNNVICHTESSLLFSPWQLCECTSEHGVLKSQHHFIHIEHHVRTGDNNAYWLNPFKVHKTTSMRYSGKAWKKTTTHLHVSTWQCKNIRWQQSKMGGVQQTWSKYKYWTPGQDTMLHLCEGWRHSHTRRKWPIGLNIRITLFVNDIHHATGQHRAEWMTSAQ